MQLPFKIDFATQNKRCFIYFCKKVRLVLGWNTYYWTKKLILSGNSVLRGYKNNVINHKM